MDAARWQRVKGILEEALEFGPAERPSFLEGVCREDEDLRCDLEALLAFEGRNGDVLEASAFAGADFPFAENYIGKSFGNYKIIEKLGEGGMGAVFLAERDDGEFRQRAAVKVIRAGIGSEAVLRRFLNERQILAELEHPNISRLIDGGTTPDGVPYLVMEYVEGSPIDDFAGEHVLSLNERLELFLRVCEAVSHAHHHLVIHRDLKPSNILVAKDGTPKLLDFGIAKLLRQGETKDTQTRQFALTPDYASPEQLKGEKLTTATDVYSLGVILYELLTGARPYKTDSRNVGEVVRIVCETEPAKPSEVASRESRVESRRKSEITDFKFQNATDEDQHVTSEELKKPEAPESRLPTPDSRLLRGDLDNIILKALRKEPDRRYSSVEQFAEDIRRHQAGLPVSASPDTWGYRFSKFSQRNRIAVAAAGLILLTLLGGLAATLYQARIARQERAKAEQRFGDVRQLANSFLFEFHDAIENLSGSTPARKLVVTRAIEYLDKLAAESGDDPTLQRELATAYEKVGKIQGNSYYSNLGDTDGAIKSYDRSLEIRQRLATADPGNREIQHELASSHEGVGDMLYTTNVLKGGLQSYEKAVAIRETILAAAPGNSLYRFALANVLAKRGDISGMEGFPNLGDTPGAVESYRRVVTLFEELVKAEPDNEKYKSGYAMMLQMSGMLLTTTGDAKGAIANGQKAAAIYEALIAADPQNTKYENALMQGLVTMRYPLLDEGRTAEAVANARRVVLTVEKESAADPANAQFERSLSVSYNSLGASLLSSGDAQGAIDNHRRSLAIVEGLAAGDESSSEHRRDISLTKQFLAEAQAAAGETEAALDNFRQSISSLEIDLQKDDSNIQIQDDLALCLGYAGKIMAAKGDLEGAAAAFRRAIPFAQKVIEKSPYNVRIRSRHGDTFSEAGKALAKLARTESGEKGAAAQRESCEYFQRSFSIWDEMRSARTLSTIYSGRPDEVSRLLDGCQ